MASTVSKKAKSFFVVMKCDMVEFTIYHDISIAGSTREKASGGSRATGPRVN